MTDVQSLVDDLARLATSFRTPTVAAELGPRLFDAGYTDALQLVHEILWMEHEDRKQRKVERLLKASRLPPGKTLETLTRTAFAPKLSKHLDHLITGAFLQNATNALLFGLPGTGKTHVAAAIGHTLVRKGHSVLFAPTYRLVQDLLAAKRDLALPRALRKLDNYDLLILDDIGYVQQDADEIEVLFTLLAERYERRSLLITSNLVFSDWDRIFKNPMTTAAAVDRLVHHSVILEFDLPSYRAEEAKKG